MMSKLVPTELQFHYGLLYANNKSIPIVGAPYLAKLVHILLVTVVYGT